MAWNHLGYWGFGNVEPLLREGGAGYAVVAGSARSVFDEVKKVLAKRDGAAVFAVNDVSVYLPVVHHMVSLHSEKLEFWRGLRKAESSVSQGFVTHGVGPFPGPDYRWENLSPHFALSGYFAMQLAYLMGFDEIVLCGCPGDGTPRFFDPAEGRPDSFVYSQDTVLQQLEAEMKRLPGFKARVRSMSGFTQQYFGGV